MANVIDTRAEQAGAGSDESVRAPLATGYLRRQLITCLGNKRSLLGPIATAVESVCADLSRNTLTMADLFSGSGVVIRLFMYYADSLTSNDLEHYAAVVSQCYLSARSSSLEDRIAAAHRRITACLTDADLEPGIIATHYAPNDDSNIRPGERAFYTRRNATFLDTARRLIGQLERDLQPFLLGPLLAEASVHANTAGVFKGFYKDRNTGVGRFGGASADALSRITGPITLQYPVACDRQPNITLFNTDANELIGTLPAMDLVYLDPPYNQHPYGSNYFMLNLLCDYRMPEQISRVSGIPVNWTRSEYNRRPVAQDRLEDLVRRVNSTHVLLSFNSEGFISPKQMMSMLESIGSVEARTICYPTFRGSRNLAKRERHVHESLYLLRK